jgi:hypothetical protein
MTNAEIIGIIVGAAGVFFAILAWLTSRRAVQVSEEELALAREEALRHPKLEVTNVSLVDAQEVEDVVRTCEAPEKWRLALERAEQEAKASQTSYSQSYVWSKAAEAMGDSYTMAQVDYEGPKPDRLLNFELRNRGRRAAKDVTGEVTFDYDTLEPLNFPGLDGEVFEGVEYGPIAKKEARLKVGRVPPFPSEESFEFRIALLQKRSGKSPVVITFSTPEGDHLEELIEFDLP